MARTRDNQETYRGIELISRGVGLNKGISLKLMMGGRRNEAWLISRTHNLLVIDACDADDHTSAPKCAAVSNAMKYLPVDC